MGNLHGRGRTPTVGKADVPSTRKFFQFAILCSRYRSRELQSFIPENYKNGSMRCQLKDTEVALSSITYDAGSADPSSGCHSSTPLLVTREMTRQIKRCIRAVNDKVNVCITISAMNPRHLVLVAIKCCILW